MKIPYSFREGFTIFSLLYYTQTLNFNSIFVLPEGNHGASADITSPLTPLLSLIQHSIFIIASLFLLLRWKSTIKTLLLNKFLILLTLLLLVSFLWSEYPDFTLRRAFSLVETVTFGSYFAVYYTGREQLRILAWAFTWVVVINLVFTLAFPRYGIEFGLHAGAWRGTIEHKNFFGRLMALGTLIFRMVVPENKKHLLLIRVGFILSFTLLLLSTSKTTLLGSLYLLLLLFPLYKSLQWNFRLSLLFQVLFVLGAGCFITIFMGNQDSITSLIGRDLTFTGRTEIWEATIYKLQDSPWLGFGYQGFWRGYSGPSYDVMKYLGGRNAFAPHAHNGLLELATAVGIIGVILFMLSFITTFKRGIHIAGSTKSRDALWILMYLSFLLIFNQTENTLVEHNSIFWVIYTISALSKPMIETPMSINATA